MKSNKLLTNYFFVTLIAVFCCGLWGSATPMIKIGYQLMLPQVNVASTMLFAGIRFFLAGLCVILFYSALRKKLLLPKRENWGKVSLVALFQTVIQYIFFYIGVANASGVKATVISGSGTFSAILIACLVFRLEHLTWRKMLACVLGFAGIILINLNGLDWNMKFFGEGFVFLATVAYGVSSSLMKQYSHSENPVVISGYQFMIGGLCMMVPGFLLGGVVQMGSWQGIVVLFYLSFLSAVAYSLWGVLLKYNPVSKVAVFSFMIPLFGVILSELLLTEESGVSFSKLLIALGLIVIGVFLQNQSKNRKEKKIG